MFGHLRSVAACAAVAGLLAVSAATATASISKAPTASVTAVGTARPATPDPGLQEELEALVREHGGPPGVIVTLKHRDSMSVYRAGVDDLATGQPPEPYDAMRIASVSKAYSGAVALLEAGWGGIGLDDTIAHWLPSLPAVWGPVTLRQLLQHTSGLPNYPASPAFQQVLREDPHHIFAPDQLLSYAPEKLEFTPGSRYQYSNSDNIAVALMLQAATHIPYEGLLSAFLYTRLGLYRTSLPKGAEMPPYYMHGYEFGDDQYRDVSTEFSASASWASGGIVSTPDELNTFIRDYGGPRLLPEHVRREQLTFIAGNSEPPGPGTNAAGLGIFQYSTRCGVVYGHTGNTPGYTQFAAASPDGTRSMTFSVNAQITPSTDQKLFDQMRKVEEDAVCTLLSR